MNNNPCPFVSELPSLSDKTASRVIDALQQIVLHLEHHYSAQIHRYYQRREQDYRLDIPPPNPKENDTPPS